jgi:peptidoglycan/xylan/chitin deacetylase (PgdA/CDA1 family)
MRAILTWHSIDSSGSPISVSAAAFRRQIAVLVAAGVDVVSVSTLLSGEWIDRDAVALTFDDGFASVAREAAPVLAEQGLPATIFVVTDCVGAGSRWSRQDGCGMPELPLLDWDALGRLASAGWTMGSHTHTHPDLTQVSPMRLEEEIERSAQELGRRLGVERRGFAYPYGAVDSAVRASVMRAHAWACTTRVALLDDHTRSFGRDDLPRLDMWYFEQPGVFERWGTPAFARWVRRRHRLRQLRAAWRRMGGR